MKNYIVRNCPAYLKYNKCLHNGHCDNITDCMLKRIVDECRNELEKRDAYSVSIHYDFAREILKFVEIEEVDEN